MNELQIDRVRQILSLVLHDQFVITAWHHFDSSVIIIYAYSLLGVKYEYNYI